MTPRNRTICLGDNLPFLRALPANSIHLVATDPPFNKSRSFYRGENGAGFRDRWAWDRDVQPHWFDHIRARHPALAALIEAARLIHGDGMRAYLCWLAIRLLAMHRVLRSDGSLYLQIDSAAQAPVKLALDAIFGGDNCRNEIVWHYKTGGAGKRWFSRKHDTLLFYSKTANYIFHPQREKSYLKHRYGFANIEIKQDAGGYFREAVMRDVWDIPALRGNQPEATGYPTQKPVALYERIIRASSDKGDIVLDPFCGSGTTAVAAERLGRQWLAMDIWDGAYDMLVQRLGADVRIQRQASASGGQRQGAPSATPKPSNRAQNPPL